MVALVWYTSYWLRFNLDVIPGQFFLLNIKRDLPYIVTIQGVVFWFLELYRGVWRFSSLPDLIRIAKAVIIGTGLIAFSFFLYDRLAGVPRAVIPLYVCLLLLTKPRLNCKHLFQQLFGEALKAQFLGKMA